jgi:hypothetical protein
MSGTEASSHQWAVVGGAKLHRGGWRRRARAEQGRAKGPAGLGLPLGEGSREGVAYSAG